MKGLSDGDESGDEFTKALDALDKQDDKTEEPTKERVNGESQSFDFDDIDGNLALLIYRIHACIF